MDKRRIYLDYASTTPVDPRVKAAMEPYLADVFGNPSSLHWFGQQASAAVFAARRAVAAAIGAAADEVIFTATATEANNLAIRGTVAAYRIRVDRRPRIIVSAIEHESVLETARDLGEGGVEVVVLPVNRQGFVDLRALEKALNDRTVLVSVMHANNEVGSVQPISKIAAVISDFRKLIANRRSAGASEHQNDLPSGDMRFARSGLWPLLHTDAAQTLASLPINVDELGVDLLTLSSHKAYGPKGAGALWVGNRKQVTGNRKGSTTPTPNTFSLSPLLAGGKQESGLRAGTENVAAIVGFAAAVEIAVRERERDRARIAKLRDALWRGLQKISPRILLNGPPLSSPHRLPGNLNISFLGYRAADLLPAFDLAGLAVSAGSACASRAPTPSHVLAAIGLSSSRASASIRFTLGRATTAREIANTLTLVKRILRRLS